VTRTVGSRFVQYYIGLQIEGEEPRSDKVYTTEHKLPFGYWLRMKRWLPVDYFDVGSEVAESLQDGLPLVEGVDYKAGFLAFTDSCVHCHNTYPHAYRLFRSSLRGFPGAVIEPDMQALSVALADKVAVEPNTEAFAGLPYKMDPNKDLVTVGISCESCHMGGREHATLEKAISFFPTNPHVSVTSRTEEKPFTGERRNPATSQGICAQCHSAQAVLTYPNGARIRNSSEAKDLLEGGCTTKIRCVTCHDPHTAGVPSGGPDLPRYLEACVKCHANYSTPEQAASHSRHAEKLGVNCLDCHMPRISQGIDEVSRTHRISLPVEQSMISGAAPNSCNLCHLDKPVRWALDELKRGWGRDIQALDKTPPERLEQPAGKLWLKSPEPIIRMVATEAYVRSPYLKANLADVLNSLNDRHAPNRSFALFSLERVLGRPLTVIEIDIRGGPAQRLQQIDVLHSKLKKKL
jgi:Cytochrome c552